MRQGPERVAPGAPGLLRILVAYAVSGFISLGYQVTWFRIFTDWYGSTSLTFALVVCNFIGGLGVGALYSERIAGGFGRALRLGDSLRVYGAVELAIGAAALVTVLLGSMPTQLLGAFPYTLDGTIWGHGAWPQTIQILTGFVCVFVPCLLMGVTFPLLCSAFVQHPHGGRLPARLYAWNTLGACAGILACQFGFILWIGHVPTFWLMLVLNALLGTYFLWSGGAPAAAPAADSAPPAAPPPGPREGLTEHYPTIVLLAALSGFVAGSLEGDLFKRVSFLAGAAPGATMTFVSFWAVLATFLASTAVHRLRGLRLGDIRIAFACAAVIYFAVWHYRAWIILGLQGGHPVPYFPASLLTLFLLCGAFAFVPYLLVSLLLPFLCNHLQAGRRHLGLAYGVNTLAFCAGLIGFALAAPSVSIFFSLRLAMLLLALGALALYWIHDLRVAWRLRVPALLGLAGLAVYATPTGFDPGAFSPRMPESWKGVTDLRADPAHTIYVVVQGPGDRRLYFDSHSMSGTDLYAQVYMRLMAHVPLLAQDDPRRALLICFGVGNTASALAAHRSLERIDVVDLSREVLLMAPIFGSSNRDVHLDPRLRMIHDDGRGFLRRTRETYDLITSEPPPPMAAGVYRLYSREYYEDALARLTPGGMMTQWLPIHQLPQEAADLILRSFVQVFPHVLLFRGIGTDTRNELILMGSRVPLSLEDAIRGMPRDPSVVRDLARIGIATPEDLRLRLVAEDAELRRRFGTGRVLEDQHNDLEHLFRTPENVAVLAREP